MNEPQGFSEFWSLWKEYQRKSDGRGKARPAYKQMLESGYAPEDIIDGARWYLRGLQSEEDKKFIPLASSWLRAERFADDCERERDFQRRLAERANVTRLARTG